ncbi:MAG: class I SAM-dependent methyltransferase [Gloeobacteraceae cyanobacterium ES-bin-316]|nr:class I SAM-dependent methyltransferase [Ferruginibacter sp.]
MTNQEGYNLWAASYNEVANPTRDLELLAKKEILEHIHFSRVLELGCGTGKNTAWLIQRADSVIGVDFSENMLEKARENVSNEKVQFVQADINQSWDFLKEPVSLVTCSLVLEHIKNIEPVFEKAFASLAPGGHLYVGELHPYKQYAGSKARFEKETETVVLECFIHSISDFISLALKNNFSLVNIKEWMDDDLQIPRILTLLFQKNN